MVMLVDPPHKLRLIIPYMNKKSHHSGTNMPNVVSYSSMEPDEKTDTHGQDAPSDALSRTPDELAEEEKTHEVTQPAEGTPTAKKASPIRRLFRKLNVYFLLFLLICVGVAVFTVVSYLNDQKEPDIPTTNSQDLSPEALKQLANTDASVGSKTQTLTIQGNAIIDGQTLMRGNLNVAGNFQSAGSIQGSSLTVSGNTNLGATQINSLQVAQNVAIQGNATVRDISVSGASTFSGAMTASQITVTNLILSGNANLQIPNHIGFTGPTPSRTINTTVLGGGGSASVSGSDTTGTVNINTGNNPGIGCFTRITFNQAFSNQPHVIISPVGAGASGTRYYVDRDRAGFSICTTAPAPANQAFAFDYFITN